MKPLYTNFLTASQQYLKSESHVSVNEQLILFKERSKHAMNMISKAAEYDFKIYSLCVENYLYSFHFTSKTSKISGLKQVKNMTDSSSVIIQLAKTLPISCQYVIYMNNFFTNLKLFEHLKELRIGACGTAKNGSGFPKELLLLRENLTKKSHWGTTAYTTVNDSVFCLAWQDNNTVQLMSTVHGPEDMKKMEYRDPKTRHGIQSSMDR